MNLSTENMVERVGPYINLATLEISQETSSFKCISNEQHVYGVCRYLWYQFDVEYFIWCGMNNEPSAESVDVERNSLEAIHKVTNILCSPMEYSGINCNHIM
jgi:hypothetical protein